MRKLPFALAAVAAVLAAPVQAKTPAPTLFIARTSPVVVQGRHFAPNEHVRVTVFVLAKSASRRVTTTATGSFAVRFPHTSTARCGVYGARAVGDRGSRAAVRVMPECANGPVDG